MSGRRRIGSQVRRGVLHAGLPKTGTTAIQWFLLDNAAQLLDEGLCYPRTGRADPRPGHHNVPMQLRDAVRYDPSAGGIDAAVAEIVASGARIGIVSAEDISFLYDRPGALERLRDAFERARLQPHVVLYVRDHRRYVVSVFVEAVKLGFFQPFPEYVDATVADGEITFGTLRFPLAFRPVIDAFVAVFGAAAVTVRGYVERNDPAAIVADLLDAAGADPSFAGRALRSAQPHNVRISTYEAMRLLWSSTAAHVGDPEVARIAEEIATRDPLAASLPCDPLGERESERIGARFAADARAMTEQLGVDPATFRTRGGTRKGHAAARALFLECERRRAAVLKAASRGA